MPVEPINLFDFEALAEHTMNKSEWDYIAGAATDEITLRRTRSAISGITTESRPSATEVISSAYRSRLCDASTEDITNRTAPRSSSPESSTPKKHSA